MIGRHPRTSMVVITVGLTVILYAIGIPSGWSDGALGWALIGSGTVGVLVSMLAEDRQLRKRPPSAG
jgi:hypothetical protein